MQQRSPFSRDYWLWLILLLALLLRGYHLAYPPWDYHNWRQTITLMVARDFARHDFHVLHPQVSWIGADQPSAPSWFSAEFSIQSILAAILYTLFGESDTIARLVVIAFSILGICALYDVLNRRAGRMAARLGAFVYAVLPYHIFFGRVFMPDVPALSLALAGLAVVDRWVDDRTWGKLAGAAALTALAILQKLTVIFVLLPMAYVFWVSDGKRFLRHWQPYVFGIIAGLPPLAWYAHALSIADKSPFAVQRDLFLYHMELWLQPHFTYDVLRALAVEAFSPLGLGLAVIGLFWPSRDRATTMFRLWVAGAGLLLILMPGVLPNNHYYLALLLPGGAALAGLAMARVAASRMGFRIVIVILAAFFAGTIQSVRPFYESDRAPYELGVLLNHLTEPGDLVVTETGGSPNALYAADRRGWLLFREYSEARLEHLKQAGARYYADAFLADPNDQRSFFRQLDNRYERLSTDDGPWPIYALAAPAAGAVEHSRRVNFGGQIEFRGIGVKNLLDWPSSFEVTYYWHCVQRPANDLRIFVHITDFTGRTVYQQDHWPQAGRFPTSRWSAAEDIAERYVIVLPASLPAGNYQMRLGWVNPDTGLRLPIVPEGADRDDRVTVAEIQVQRPPRFGWLRMLN